jgi:hypothetical protein
MRTRRTRTRRYRKRNTRRIKRTKRIRKTKRTRKTRITHVLRGGAEPGPKPLLKGELTCEFAGYGLKTATWVPMTVAVKDNGSISVKQAGLGPLSHNVVIPSTMYYVTPPKTARVGRKCFRINLRNKMAGVKKLILDVGTDDLAKWVDTIKTIKTAQAQASAPAAEPEPEPSAEPEPEPSAAAEPGPGPGPGPGPAPAAAAAAAGAGPGPPRRHYLLVGHGGRIMWTFCKEYQDSGQGTYSIINSKKGDPYDNYPKNDKWKTGEDARKGVTDLASTVTDIMIPEITKIRPDCILCGSRGGQITVPCLWRKGHNLPAVVLNGGCIYSGITPPANLRAVLLTGGRDWFNNPDCEKYGSEYTFKLQKPQVNLPEPSKPRWLTAKATAKAKTTPFAQSTVFVVHDPTMWHLPERTRTETGLKTVRLNTMLPYLIEAAISGLPEGLHALKAKFSDLEIYQGSNGKFVSLD